MWARVDDGWWCHPKTMECSLAASGLWVQALSWSCQQRTDVVPNDLLGMVGATSEQARELVDAGSWIPVDGGWRIHGWADYVHEPTPGRRALPRDVRCKVIRRDAYVCGICKGFVPPDDVHIDHIVPVAHGGTDDLSNLQVAHSGCNLSKGATV